MVTEHSILVRQLQDTPFYIKQNAAVGSIKRAADETGWTTPIDGDLLVTALPAFTPSAGNLWAQPGVTA
jgi:hypothetical protein